ncbi:MAG: ABC transporter ATP-binding protein [Desulfobacterales bacterium S7086C20]|nr:ABC transporter ATP-binding protein [Deltaproteobacteria bacterium]OEU44404.1 MAG: ABC transporter ATP-binding protein [Desulfobacterales bacterium S7086C20]
MPLLKVNNIETYYDDIIEAIRGISIEVSEGQIVTVLGSNGAGKTTLLHTISRTLDDEGQPEKGTIEFMGKRIEREAPEKIVALGLSHVPEGRQLFPKLSVQENLRMGTYIRRRDRDLDRDYAKVFEHFPILKKKKGQRAETLSGGEQQMVAIGRALMSRPKLLLLDEPSLGLSPLIVDQIFQIMKRINEEGTAILLVEQNALRAFSVAEFGYILENGRIVLSDTTQWLMEQEDVKEFYLGITKDMSVKGYKRYKRKKRWR